MLVLSRKPEETIQIGNDITITIIKTKGKNVRIGIEAPKEMRIVRGELPRMDKTSETNTTLPLDGRPLSSAHSNSRCPSQVGCKDEFNDSSSATDSNDGLDHHSRRSPSTDRWTVTSMRQRVRMAQMTKTSSSLD